MKKQDYVIKKLQEYKGVFERNKKYGSLYMHLYSNLDNRFDFDNGGIKSSAESIAYFEELYLKRKQNYYIVQTKFLLGDMYAEIENISRAKECYQYVVNNGNKLAVVKIAEEKLRLIG